MDRFESMSVALVVAEAGSLSEAARRLKSPLATVSRQLSDLERHLETKLFNRSTRALVLTDAGRSYIAASKRILADIAEAERAAAGEYTTPRGELSMSAPVVMGRILLLPVLEEFLKAFPQVDVQLTLQDRAVNLLEEHVDVVLRLGNLADSSLIAVRLGEVQRVAYASPGYLKARGIPKTPEDLKVHDCISYATAMSPKSWSFMHKGVEHTVPVHSRLVVSSLEAALHAARVGMGVTQGYSYIGAEHIKDGTLQLVLPSYELPSTPVSMVYASNRFMPVKLRAFLDFATPRLKEALSIAKVRCDAARARELQSG